MLSLQSSFPTRTLTLFQHTLCLQFLFPTLYCTVADIFFLHMNEFLFFYSFLSALIWIFSYFFLPTQTLPSFLSFHNFLIYFLCFLHFLLPITFIQHIISISFPFLLSTLRYLFFSHALILLSGPRLPRFVANSYIL
jgi:hypothetical protein